MIDLVVIGAILHFCILGHKLVQAYEYDIYNRQYVTEEEDDGYR